MERDPGIADALRGSEHILEQAESGLVVVRNKQRGVLRVRNPSLLTKSEKKARRIKNKVAKKKKAKTRRRMKHGRT